MPEHSADRTTWPLAIIRLVRSVPIELALAGVMMLAIAATLLWLYP